MVDALAEKDYIAKRPEELSINRGDIIKDVTRKASGWFEGIHNDKRGLFPEHCVTMLNKDSGVVLRNKHHTGRQCKVIYSYNQDHNDELNLKIGDIIDILGEEEEGWWRGLLNGKEGVFPSNFVQEIVPTKSKSKHSSREDLSSDFIEHESRCPILPPKPAKTFCEVKYAYKAQNEDELTLNEHDIITLVSKDAADPGWWKGELHGKVGVFPDNFVEILPASVTMDTNSTTILAPARPDTLPDVAGLKHQQHGMNATQRTSLHETRIGSDGVAEVKNPPVPSKKPFVPVKKSPSGSGGIFSGLRKKLENNDKRADSVDGSVGSKGSAKYDVKNKQDENQNAFDQVERNSLLKDVRAGRARPPVRRPPTAATKDDTLDTADPETSQEEPKHENKPETSDGIVEIKPQVREWEKHKAPWLEEMKMNQAKRSSTSPGPEVRKPIVEPIDEIIDKKLHVAPVSARKDSPESPVDMSKSMPNIQRIKSPAAPQETVAFRAATAKAENLTSNHVENHSKVDVRAAGDATMNSVEGFVTVKQYAELWHRVEALETLLDRQSSVIEQLRGKLAEETDRRVALESRLERMSQCMDV